MLCILNIVSLTKLFQVGDLLNFLSAVFFGVHTLRTEHISRNTKKENFLALIGYEVRLIPYCVYCDKEKSFLVFFVYGLNSSSFSIQVFIVALSSTLWHVLGGCFGGIQEFRPSSWTWAMLWNWMVTFPWIPAVYTGVFSTGLCLWVEVHFLVCYLHDDEILNIEGSFLYFQIELP